MTAKYTEKKIKKEREEIKKSIEYEFNKCYENILYEFNEWYENILKYNLTDREMEMSFLELNEKLKYLL